MNTGGTGQDNSMLSRKQEIQPIQMDYLFIR